jgi:hypothetical protein
MSTVFDRGSLARDRGLPAFKKQLEDQLAARSKPNGSAMRSVAASVAAKPIKYGEHITKK